MNYDLKTFPSDTSLAQAAAAQWLALVETAAQKRTSHFVAVSGGRIAKTFFTQVVEQSQTRLTTWSHVHFFWADERCLPPDHAESNFKMAWELLLQPLHIAEEKIHRLKGEMPPEIAVAQANAVLQSLAPKNEEGIPVLDLILLGMGEDGHVASLFPAASAAVEKGKAPFLWVSDSPKPPPQRLSLSYPAIAAAQKVWVLVSGKGKEAVLQESLTATASTPLAKVLRARMGTQIFTDGPVG